MCGIGGIVCFDGTAPPEDALQRMLTALSHRGPDGQGLWREGPLALAHTRLSIIDPDGSAQPMDDGQRVLVLNGEILNYRELRHRLDYPYRTAGDAETVLAAHGVHGAAAPLELHGQFAYALYERGSRLLTLVRDRMGILPLYWCHDGRRLVFGSELDAVLAGLREVPQLDQEALADYLARRSTAAPRTLLAGIRKLRPGHRLQVRADGTCRELSYWTPEQHAIAEYSESEAVDRLDELVGAAVRRALIADVPVGSYLSGGVDSSLIAARACALGDGPLHTYCAEFGDARVDESSYAHLVASALGTVHHTVPVRPADFEDLWPALSRHRGAPLSEPADIAVHRLAEAARREVKVVLSGEGSDELFAGYPKHRFAAATSYAGVVPTGVRRPVLTSLERHLPGRQRRLGVALRALAEPSAAERRLGWFAPFTAAERAALLGTGLRGDATRPRGGSLRAMLLDDLRAWLPDNLLERGDRMTMAASVELRPPFLDDDIVEFALSLPERLLVRGGTTKWLVKQVARRHLPTVIVQRPKSGFRVPLDAWFRDGLHDLARDLVSDPASITRAHLDPAAVTGIFDAHRAGRRDESIRIWTLASLEMWHRGLRDGIPVQGAPAVRAG